ncbi:hypothetical protein GRI40_12815 [Altererythrobacter aerius]|uniref:DUF7507 domain-containing protein n=1 Tax=Tsuneonella aeria TaxID=1837929 RepID=A0A6I4TI14_9SPHN|nr:SdrD B-like domain-containing protein [Tsuneonella aeria]MXO76098.1 hypothetical protein [Tsuneonella aeria]
MAIRVDTDGNGTWDKELQDPSVDLIEIVDETGDGIKDVNLTQAESAAVINGAIFQDAANVGSGTGGYNTFLALDDRTGGEVPQNYSEAGFNSDEGNPLNATNAEIDVSKTKTLLLGAIPVKVIDGVAYYEFRVDLNESDSVPDTNISLDQFKLYTSTNGNIQTTTQLFDGTSATLRYDMDATGNVSVLLSEANSSGSGNDDYSVLVPVSYFEGVDVSNNYLYLYVEMGAASGPGATANSDWVANGGFEEWNVQNAFILRGTKFNDIDSDGVRDAGEGGVAGVTVFIDADGDGVLDGDTNGNGVQDAGETITERYTITDANGSYAFGGLTAGTYRIDEVTPAGQVQTTGDYETVTVTTFTPGQVFNVDPIGNHVLTPHVTIEKTFIDVTDGPDAGSSTAVLDGNGDVANYEITVLNDGETALANVIVTDALADAGAIAVMVAGAIKGDTDKDGVLDIGEKWYYTATQTASQSDIDDNGGGDGESDNSATVVATQQGTSNTVTDTDDASAPILRAPAIAITKVFEGWSGGDGDAIGDFAGDVANYTIVVTNTGNVTLTDVEVTDPLTGNVYEIGTLAPGASSAPLVETYTLTQADLDSNGTLELDDQFAGSIDNTARATSSQTGPAAASAVAPIVYAPALAIDKVVVDVDGRGPDATADDAGDLITYRVTVTNTGNITLTGVTAVDPLTGLDVAVGTLLPGATWTSEDLTYEVTQADLDTRGGGDNDIDNTATADSNETGSSSDSEEVPLDYSPALAIDKVVVDVDGRGPDATADDAGDLITYRVTVTNTGNITLTGVTAVDPLTGLDVAVGTLLPGATWTSEDLTYEVTQADLDTRGGGDNDIDNTATADSNETGSSSDSEEVPLDYSPRGDVEKNVSLDGVTYTDEDDPTGPMATTANNPIYFQVVISNVGNITLTGITLDDQLMDYGTGLSSNINYTTVNAYVDLDNDGMRDAGEDWATLDADNNGTLDDLTLAPGASVKVYYELPFAAGQHTNTVELSSAQAGVSDFDAANYFGVVNDGPGVRTPGFWQNPKNGGLFWDGNTTNDPQKGENFPGYDPETGINTDIRYAVDSNNDGVINAVAGDGINDAAPLDRAGLLIGDYDMDGIRDPGEDVLFVSYQDALRLVGNEDKGGNNVVHTLGRDVVATWLNYLAGNNIDPTDMSDPGNIANAPRHYIDDAVAWLQKFSSSSSPSDADFATFMFGTTIKSSSAAWKSPASYGGDHSGAQIHAALDSYNNDGVIFGETYAGDGDSSAFAFALNQAVSLELFSGLDQSHDQSLIPV